MKRRMITVLLFALIAALVPSTLIYRALAGRGPARLTGPIVAVAARDLSVGSLILDADIRTGEWTGPVDPHWVLRKEDLVGRGVTANVNRGEPIADNRLAPRGAGAGLAAIIPQGMRAAAVRVDDVVGVSGFVLPGMHVDILTSGTPPGGSGTITRTILQNVEVLSAGQNLERDAQGKPAAVQVVNLLVTPPDAERLSLASGQMKVQLILRNPLDTAKVKTLGISSSGLLLDGSTEPAPPRPTVAPRPRPVPAPIPVPAPVKAPEAAPAPLTIEVIHGSKKESIVVGRLY
jgi:pilus assembly protein CpaB